MRIGDAFQIPVLVSSGATAVGSSRIAGPGRGPGPEGSEEPLAAAVNAPSMSTIEDGRAHRARRAADPCQESHGNMNTSAGLGARRLVLVRLAPR